MNDIYSVLNQLKITYEKYEHPAVFTVEAAEKYDRGIKEARNKIVPPLHRVGVTRLV